MDSLTFKEILLDQFNQHPLNFHPFITFFDLIINILFKVPSFQILADILTRLSVPCVPKKLETFD